MANETGTKQQGWWEPIVEFAAHFLAGSVIFIMLAAISLALAWIVHWLEGWPEIVDSFVVSVFQILEYVVLVVDVVVYGVYIVGSAIKAVTTMVLRWRT